MGVRKTTPPKYIKASSVTKEEDAIEMAEFRRWAEDVTRKLNSMITVEGGFAIPMINKTGAPSVKGTIITAGSAVDNSFTIQTVEYEACGVVYDDAVPDGKECLVVVAGIAQVLLEDSTSAVRGYWVRCATTDGRATVTTAPSSIGAIAASEHFKEIGHCVEEKAAGTNVLAKVLLHFN